MRKKTAQPRPKHRKTAESEKKKGLIAQKKTTGPSERAKFVLDNRSHRTTNHAIVENGADGVGFYNYPECARNSVKWIKPALKFIGMG